jgi:hypothetical protein
MTKVRFIVAWQFYQKGQVIEPTAMLRDWLLSRRFVEMVDPNPTAALSAAASPAAASMPQAKAGPGRPGRGRPSKAISE